MGEKPNQDVAAAAADGDVDTLKAGIEETRAEIGETLEAIQERLAPANVARNAADAVKENAARKMENMMNTAAEKASEMASQAQQTAAQVTDQVRENPVPAAIISLGLGWLAYRAISGGASGRSRGYRSGYDRDYRSGYDYESEWQSYGAQERSGSWVQSIADHPIPAALASLGIGWLIQQRAAGGGSYRQPSYRTSGGGSWGDSAREMTDDAGERIRHSARRTTHQLNRMSNDVARMFRQNPIAFGVAAAALGAAIGLSVPETETENELLGDTRDALVGRVRDAASNAVQTLGG